MVKTYDVVIVGAGPAGAAAAAVLAGRGRAVALLDRAAHPRFKLCGGLLTAKTLAALSLIFGLSEADLAARGGLFHSSADYVFLHHGRELLRGRAAEPFRFISRPVFDALLTSVAAGRGAEFFPKRRAVSCDSAAGLVRTADGAEFRGRFVLGADGVNSLLRRAVPCNRAFWRRGLGQAIEVELSPGPGPGRFPRRVVAPELHVGAPDVPSAGYGWVFPGPGGTVKVGIGGLPRPGEPPFSVLMRRFLRLLGVADPESVPLRGHPLPYGNALPQPYSGRLLLAGDAAGFVEPLFGEGIFYALATGAHAASAVLAGLGCDDPAAARCEYARLLQATVRPEFLWSGRLRWVLFWTLRHLGVGSLTRFVRTAPGPLAAMVHGRRSFRLLLPKHWQWGEGVS